MGGGGVKKCEKKKTEGAEQTQRYTFLLVM